MPYRILPDDPALSCTPCRHPALPNIWSNLNLNEYDPATYLRTNYISFLFQSGQSHSTLLCSAWVQDELLVDWETKGGCKLQCSGSGSCSTDPDLDVILHLFIKNPLKFSAEHLKK